MKIRDKERLEPPHVTIFRKVFSWRINLRTGGFMDASPEPREVPDALVQHIRAAKNWSTLREQWDRMYPTNTVEREPDGDDDV